MQVPACTWSQLSGPFHSATLDLRPFQTIIIFLTTRHDTTPLKYANIAATSYCCATVLLRTFYLVPQLSRTPLVNRRKLIIRYLSLFPSLTWLPSLDYLIWHVSRPIIIAIKGLVALPP